MITRILNGNSEYCGGQENNTTQSDPDEAADEIARIAYSIVAPVIVAIGILGNILNLFVLSRPFLKGGTRVFLTALAISDLSVLITAIPMVIRLNNAHGHTFPSAFFHAHVEIFLTNIFIGSSVFIVVCLTIERYFSVCLPTDFRSVHTKKNARKAVLGCYIMGILVSVPLMCLKTVCRESNDQWSFKENTDVTNTVYWNLYIWISECLVRIGPCVVLATLNILIIRKFRIIAAKRKLLRAALAKGEPKEMFIYNQDPVFRKSLKNKRYQEEKRLIGLLRSIVVLFFITITPSSVLSLMYSEDYEPKYAFQVFRGIANNLELANFALNFYVYCLCSREFRAALIKVFAGCFACEDDSSDENFDEELASNVLKSCKTSDFENPIHHAKSLT